MSWALRTEKKTVFFSLTICYLFSVIQASNCDDDNDDDDDDDDET